ncbi:MAG: hypothetical protein LBG52_07510 [Candidatus Peribacteria bacterium]|jgi:hypothetical protein|nr:hypothetical protein [Candidatus Peribacteria bacterium]
MSGVNTNDIEYTYAMPLASSDNDGIMPKESFSTVETLVTKVAALT